MSAVPSEDIARLEWPVLSRFTQYVRDMSDGRVFLERGATETAEGMFSFPLVQVSDVDEAHRTYTFDGTVRFTGHGGMLNLPIGGIEVTVSSTGSTHLSIADPDEPDVRLLFATAVATTEMEQVPLAISLALALAEDGSELYFYRYPKGFALEPAHIFFSHPVETDGPHPERERLDHELR